jgi:HSP20 family protein
MANVDVKNKTSETNERSLERRQGERGLSSRWGWDPFDLFGSDPFSLMRRFQDEMDRAFGRFSGGQSGGESRLWRPAIEVAENNGQLQIHAELPGLKPEDVKVEMTDDALVIQGERKDEHEENKGGVYRSERRYGRFYREIPLPQGAKAEQAKAQFRNGVLEVTLPVPDQKSNRRSIQIETASDAGGKTQK